MNKSNLVLQKDNALFLNLNLQGTCNLREAAKNTQWVQLNLLKNFMKGGVVLLPAFRNGDGTAIVGEKWGGRHFADEGR